MVVTPGLRALYSIAVATTTLLCSVRKFIGNLLALFDPGLRGIDLTLRKAPDFSSHETGRQTLGYIAHR